MYKKIFEIYIRPNINWILLFLGFLCFVVTFNGEFENKESFIGLGIIGAGCFISYAILEKNKK